MIAKCAHCGLIRIPNRMRKTCPHCKTGKLSNPTIAELHKYEDTLMERTRAAVCLCNAKPHDEALKLMAFMAVIEGKPITRGEAERMLSE